MWTTTALNNLGWSANERKDYAVAKEYQQQMLALAREVGLQVSTAFGLSNLASTDIELGQLDCRITITCDTEHARSGYFDGRD